MCQNCDLKICIGDTPTYLQIEGSDIKILSVNIWKGSDYDDPSKVEEISVPVIDTDLGNYDFSIDASTLGDSHFKGLYILEISYVSSCGEESLIVPIADLTSYHKCLLDAILNENGDKSGCNECGDSGKNCVESPEYLSALIKSLETAILEGMYKEASEIQELIESICECISCQNCSDCDECDRISLCEYRICFPHCKPCV